MPSTKWDQRFLDMAMLVSGWSKDPNARVGAVLVDAHGQVANVGYNGFPKSVEDTFERMNSELKPELVVHAEMNAVVGAGDRARGGTLYVFGKPVCARCAGPIIQAGVAHVVAPPPRSGTDDKWENSGLVARRMFEEARLGFVSSLHVD